MHVGDNRDKMEELDLKFNCADWVNGDGLQSHVTSAEGWRSRIGQLGAAIYSLYIFDYLNVNT